MRSRTLGTTGLELTELGFGGGAIGGLYRAVTREDAFSTMDAAWALGMRYFDTAPFYGFGLSERRVGDFLRGKPRADYILSTKVGKLLHAVPISEVPDHGFVEPLPFDVRYDYSYDGIMRSLEFSLARLGLNEIDILYVHDLEISSLGEDRYRHHFSTFMDGGLKALDKLKSDGTIRAYGLGSNEVSACVNVLSRAPLDLILLAGRYTLLDRSGERDLLPLCADNVTSLVIGGVFNSGILASGAVSGASFNYRPATLDIVERVNAMDRIAIDNGTLLAAAAIQFPLLESSVSSVLIGTAQPDILARNAELATLEIDNAVWSRLEPHAIR